MVEEQTIQKTTIPENKIEQNQGDKYTLKEQTDNNTKEIERLKKELSNERFIVVGFVKTVKVRI